MNVEPIHYLSVLIVRFVDDHQPGFVACEFQDADGQTQTLVDKVPIFTTEYLDADSDYPKQATAACVVLSRWRDAAGRDLVRISTVKPCCIETAEGMSEFVVLASQLQAEGEPAERSPK